METIAVLDLGDWACGGAAADRFAAALREALEDTGFVAVEGHGVDADTIASAYEAFARFFALPEAAKRACVAGEGGARGHTPFGREHAKDASVADLKEFFHVGRERYAPNVWPREIPELAERALALYDALDRCGARLLAALERGYALAPGTLSDMVRDGNSVLRALRYPPLPPSIEPGALRAAPHEDINLITLLCEASDAGLEILGRDGRWLPVEAPPGRIVVDAGDMLCRVTGGVVPATTHRVVNPEPCEGGERYSLPFFAHPRPECSLHVLERFASAERLAAHPPITAGEYLEERLREIGLLDR